MRRDAIFLGSQKANLSVPITALRHLPDLSRFDNRKASAIPTSTPLPRLQGRYVA
jgi:hypothetical protein